ncbi:DNA polymerase [Saccharothrix sp. NRRL B-16348]|uniref:error-prone DNA polymerase n=1 Tax=Saccharothrix sp. NRRL B-16348 TaxID=1415542 RepID=UPI0006AE5D8E|nr:error-prone DNA polymerase [Saccharothrix sp. NRRL B-16348]KOX21230.1 DNA polymerase [Saccharothrix sp. NRRL B-16348]
MGFDSGTDLPWAQLERALSGRVDAAGHCSPGPRGRDGYVRAEDLLDRRVTREDQNTARVPYAELHCHSNFSFLDGASHPEELVEEAARLGLDAVALTDHDGMHGVVRFAEAARELGVHTVYGSELSVRSAGPRTGVPDPIGEHLLVLARGAEGYRRLCSVISDAHLRGEEKGSPVYDLDQVVEELAGHVLVLTGCRKGAVRRALKRGGAAEAAEALGVLVDRFGRQHVAVELVDHALPEDSVRNDLLAALATQAGLPVVATNAVHYATPRGGRVAAAMASVRARLPLERMAGWLPPHGQAALRAGERMARRFARFPGAVHHAALLGLECAFDLRLVAPRLPPFDVPEGHTEASWLRELTAACARERYGPPEADPRAWAQLEHELDIIERLDFPGYFLIVHDIVEFCRRNDILCQGRGSAANSAVCYALGVTNVDAVKYDLLFERFLSVERDGPPDIDLDIESDRREMVIQYVYRRYGRRHAAQVANVITYRARSAIRDAAHALGYPPGSQDAWSKRVDGWGTVRDAAADNTPDNPAGHTTDPAAGDRPVTPGQADGIGHAPARSPESGGRVGPIPREVLLLAAELEGAPRHLGIHSGGMVICDRPVAEVVPVERARMPGRTVLQWDKDDCATAGLVKFDLLGLGMLSAIRYTRDLVAEHEGIQVDLARLDLTDPAVYDMLEHADTVGVFQVESRAQMGTLPRLRPRSFWDIAVQVALIRPGPIQGGSVHPYLRRRRGEPWNHDHPLLAHALDRTLGVPLFQEQVMQVAIDVAGFSPGEADELRRAMGSKRALSKMERLRERFYAGAARNGITGELADRIFLQAQAFSGYGFPLSHALSFAHIVFQSAWFKLYHPAAFCAALLRAQPMGFYSPQSLIADARRHGVRVLRADVDVSLPHATLEPDPDSTGGHAVRLGLGAVRDLGDDAAEHITTERHTHGPYTDLGDLARRTGLTTTQLEALATAGALGSLHPDRRAALWQAGAAAREHPERLAGTSGVTTPPALPGMTTWDLIAADMRFTGVTPDDHPVRLLRTHLTDLGAIPADQLADVPHGTRVLVGGAVTHRQRPGTAGGITFINIEDETGMINVVVSVGLWRTSKSYARDANALLVRGIIENASGAVNLVADQLRPLDPRVAGRSRDFR